MLNEYLKLLFLGTSRAFKYYEHIFHDHNFTPESGTTIHNAGMLFILFSFFDEMNLDAFN